MTESNVAALRVGCPTGRRRGADARVWQCGRPEPMQRRWCARRASPGVCASGAT